MVISRLEFPGIILRRWYRPSLSLDDLLAILSFDFSTKYLLLSIDRVFVLSIDSTDTGFFALTFLSSSMARLLFEGEKISYKCVLKIHREHT